MSAALDTSALDAIAQILVEKPDILKRVLAVMESAVRETGDSMAAVQGPIQLELTPTVQRNYVRRAVFERFRPEHAAKILPNLTAVFYVSVEDAEVIVEDAKEHRYDGNGPRGETMALTSLIRGLEAKIKGEKYRGCIEFPGAEIIEAGWRAASAVLEVGTHVEIWFPNGSSGGRAKITKSYGPCTVREADGPYVHTGERVEYRYGYTAKDEDGEDCFYPAHMLAPVGKSYGHLRLVKL